MTEAKETRKLGANKTRGAVPEDDQDRLLVNGRVNRVQEQQLSSGRKSPEELRSSRVEEKPAVPVSPAEGEFPFLYYCAVLPGGLDQSL